MVVETGSWDHEILWARWIPSTTELKKKKKSSDNEWNVRKDYHFYIHPRLRGILEDKQLSKETPCLFFH